MKGLPSKEKFTTKAIKEYMEILDTKYTPEKVANATQGPGSMLSLAIGPSMAFFEAVSNLYDWLEKSEE